eukprot:Em0005g346a
MGKDSTLRRAKDALYWPNMAKDIKAMISKCQICEEDSPAQSKEKLQAHSLSPQPWGKVETDLFEYKGKDCLVVVVYLSDFFKVSELSQLSAAAVIRVLKEHFARHGIPVIVQSDGAPTPPSAPTITSLISTYSDQRTVTVTWTSVPTATSYNVSINDCVNTLVPIPSTGAPQYTFTGLTNNTVYTVSVVAINCAGSSSPATMTNRTSNGPAAPPLLPSATTPTPSTTTSGPCTAAVGSSIGTAVGVSVSVTFVVSFSMGVLVAYVLGYISRRSKESSHKPSSHADPATVHDMVTNKKMKGDAMEIVANTAYGSHVSSTVYDEVGNNKKMKGDAMEMNTNTAYGSHVS